MLPFTHLSIQLLFHMYCIREGPDRCRNVLVFPICRWNQCAMGASRRDNRQVEQPRGQTTFPARSRSLIWFQHTGRDDGHASRDLWFFKYIPHTAIDHRQTSLCSSAKRALRERSICNVITQMRMAERWTDTNPLFPPVPSIVYGDSCGDRPCQVSHRLQGRWLPSPWHFIYFFNGEGSGYNPHLTVTFYEEQ